ncbi:hypothetical protein LCGC14_0610680 [marine sediment metagenome]|uniref:Uncharacterized protein n=1 Tax=marine sediment metagenome TaxID=412755 RepID=A0A0F9UG89_9ZZZZ
MDQKYSFPFRLETGKSHRDMKKKNGNSIYIVESVGLKIIGTKNLI